MTATVVPNSDFVVRSVLDSIVSDIEYDQDFRALMSRSASASASGGAMGHFNIRFSPPVEVDSDEVPALAPYVQEGQHLLIQASYACKKSVRIRELFKHYLAKCGKPPEDVRILCTSVRIIHAHDLSAQLGESFGFVSYKDEVEKNPFVDLTKANKLIISMESMHKLLRHSTSNVPQYDFLVVDEARSLVDVFSKKDTVNSETSVYMFEQLLLNTPFCIFADADICYDNAVTEMIQAITPNKGFQRLHITKHKLKRRLKLYFSQEQTDGAVMKPKTSLHQFYEQLVRPAIQEAILNREKVAFACASKSGHSDRIAAICRQEGLVAGESYQTYNSKTSDHVKKKHFKDVDTAWESFVVVSATTSLTVAVDPRSTRFSKLFLITKRSEFCGQQRDLSQQLGRYNRWLPDETLDIICYIDDVHPAYLPLLQKQQAQKRCKQGTGSLPSPTLESCLKEVQDESDEAFSLWVRNLGGNVPPALMAQLRERAQKPWLLRMRAYTLLEKRRQSAQGEHLRLLKQLADMRGWQCEYCSFDQTKPVPRPAGHGDTAAGLDEAAQDAVFDQVYIHVKADGGGVQDFFDSGAYRCEERAKSGVSIDEWQKAFVDVFYRLCRFGRFDIVDHVPLSDKKVAKYSRLTSEVLAATKLRSLCTVGDVEKERVKDHKRLLDDGFEKAGMPNAARIEAVQKLFALVGLQGKVLAHGTTFDVPDIWCDLVKNGPNQYNATTTKLSGSDELLSVTLKDILRGLGMVSQCRYKKNLYIMLQRMFKAAGICLHKKATGRRRANVTLTLSNDPLIEYLTPHYRLWHDGIEEFVSVGEWDQHSSELERYYAELSTQMNALKNEQAVWGDTCGDGMGDADVVYEELVCDAGLNQLIEEDNPLEREMLSAILQSLEPSANEPGKRCLRRIYHKKGLYGREWPRYPSMGYVSRRIRGMLCKPLYWDLDMVKCHARICLNIAKRFHLKLPALQRYIDEPDKVLAELSTYYLGATKSAVKMLVNSVLNRGTVGGWVANQEQWELQVKTGMAPREAKSSVPYGGVIEESMLRVMGDFNIGKQIMDKIKNLGNHPIITEFDSNIRSLHALMKQAYPDVFQSAFAAIDTNAKLQRKYSTKEQKERKAFSDCLFEVENRLLNAIVHSLRKQGFRVDAKIHDGCHVRRKEGMSTLPEDVIDRVVVDVKVDTGFDISLKVKELEIGPAPKMTHPPAKIKKGIESFETYKDGKGKKSRRTFGRKLVTASAPAQKKLKLTPVERYNAIKRYDCVATDVHGNPVPTKKARSPK